jgi:hypothetical protein
MCLLNFARHATNSTEIGADEVNIARHHEFCSAIPFPTLNWDDAKNTETNLAELHDYAVQLANSGLDWYLQKKKRKELFAKILHNLTYFSAILAAIVPLAMIIVPEFKSLGSQFPNSREFAAEAALLLIGIAGGFNVIDRAAGYSADWMRYIVTATRLNRALVDFEFKWNAFIRAASGSQMLPLPDAKAVACAPETPKTAVPTDLVQQRIDLVREFCMLVLDIIGGETEVWANELKERVAQMARNLQSPAR